MVIDNRLTDVTFTSFKIEIPNTYNESGMGSADLRLTNSTIQTNYDQLPQPLFVKSGLSGDMDSSTWNTLYKNATWYSTVDYLRSCNEEVRASMCAEFAVGFDKLFADYPWLVQKVDELNNITITDPKLGRRLKPDAAITITCDETVDGRVWGLLNMYKHIAYDDEYQRWILPDMMRYFTMYIYVTEFRNFHRPQQLVITSEVSRNRTKEERIQDRQNKRDKVTGSPTGKRKEYVESLGGFIMQTANEIAPTTVYKCEQCEFDLTTFRRNGMSSLDVGQAPSKETITFSIKIGKVRESHVYPAQKRIFDSFLINQYNFKTDRSGISMVSTDSAEEHKRNTISPISMTESMKQVHLYTNPNPRNSAADKQHYGTMPDDSGQLPGPYNTSKFSALVKENSAYGHSATLPDGAPISTSFLQKFVDSGIGRLAASGTEYVNSWVTGAMTKKQDWLGGKSLSDWSTVLGSGDAFAIIKASVEAAKGITAGTGNGGSIDQKITDPMSPAVDDSSGTNKGKITGVSDLVQSNRIKVDPITGNKREHQMSDPFDGYTEPTPTNNNVNVDDEFYNEDVNTSEQRYSTATHDKRISNNHVPTTSTTIGDTISRPIGNNDNRVVDITVTQHNKKIIL